MKIYIDEELPKSCASCQFLVHCDQCEGTENYCPFVGSVGYDKSYDPVDPVTPTEKRDEECPLEHRPHGEWIEKPWGVVCSRCKAQAPFSPNGNQLESEFCPVCGSRKVKNTDPEIDKPDDLLTYYTTRCTSCGKVSPVGDYCIWCGEKDTCFGEGGDQK